MQHVITRAELAPYAVHSEDLRAFLVESETPAVNHREPFAKRTDGRDRRAERKAKEARRYDWFNE